MAETTEETKYEPLKALKQYGTASNDWYKEFGFEYKQPPDKGISYDTDEGGNHSTIANMVVEIMPPPIYGADENNGDNKTLTNPTTEPSPIPPTYPPITEPPIEPPTTPPTTEPEEDTFGKYFGRGSFIYAPNNNGNIATQGYASATGNQANDEGKVYAQGTGHVFEGSMPGNDSTGGSGNYSINAENLAGHVTNNLQGINPLKLTAENRTIYGHNQETGSVLSTKHNNK